MKFKISVIEMLPPTDTLYVLTGFDSAQVMKKSDLKKLREEIDNIIE